MAQSIPRQGIPQVDFRDIKDPNALVQGSTRETRIYYRPATVTSFIDKTTGNELKSLTQELAKEIKRRVSLGEVEERTVETWIPTTPLPADMWHMNHYAKKGFRLYPPGQEPSEMELMKPQISGNKVSCPVEGCSFLGNSFIGLARHMAKIHKRR